MTTELIIVATFFGGWLLGAAFGALVEQALQYKGRKRW